MIPGGDIRRSIAPSAVVARRYPTQLRPPPAFSRIPDTHLATHVPRHPHFPNLLPRWITPGIALLSNTPQAHRLPHAPTRTTRTKCRVIQHEIAPFSVVSEHQYVGLSGLLSGAEDEVVG